MGVDGGERTSHKKWVRAGKGQQLFPLSLSPISTIQVMGGSLEKKGPIIIDNQSSTQKLTLSQRATVVCQAVEKFNPGS